MISKNYTTLKVKAPDKDKFDEILRKASMVQNNKITKDELFRRVINSPIVEKMIIDDAELKRRLKR